MNKAKWLVVVCAVLCAGIAYAEIDVTAGEIVEHDQSQPASIVLPANFDASAATAALREARRAGDQEQVRELSAQLQAWWQSTSVPSYTAEEIGANAEPPEWNKEGENTPTTAPDWGTDVRMAPEDGVRDVKIASLSNGDLYSISIRVDGSTYYGLMHRSTDNGQTWSTCWNNQFSTGYSISSVGLNVANDTIITWYVLRDGSGLYRTWVRVVLPGASVTAIYFGSPTGGFNPVTYNNLRVTTDAPVWGTSEYLYATWSEQYGTGPDSTRVMFAASWENDVSTWETAPIRLRASNGANIYYTGTRIAFGSSTDRLWIVAWLHPNLYGTTYDRIIRGWYSDDYGSTWNTTPVDITSSSNGLDEYDCAIAGSHSNTNWVILATQDTMTTGVYQDVNNWYSTDDGATWTYSAWITNFDNTLADVWVDDDNHAFFAACRSNTGSDEHIRYKQGLITNPTSWTGSVIINDNTSSLSDVYGPSVSYNYDNNDAIIAWNAYFSNIYSIWFDSQDWTGIVEHEVGDVSAMRIALAPNPARGLARLTFVTRQEGRVAVNLYDAAGRLARNLLDASVSAGEHTVTIDGKNLSAGVYFVRVDTPDGADTRTMTVVR